MVRGSVDLVGDYWQAAKGDQSVDLNGLTQGTIQREVRTVPGEPLVLKFALAGNPEHACGPVRRRAMVVRFAGSKVGRYVFDARGQSVHDMGWTDHVAEVQSDAETATLSFHSRQHEGCAGLVVNHVRLRPAKAPVA